MKRCGLRFIKKIDLTALRRSIAKNDLNSSARVQPEFSHASISQASIRDR